MADRESGNQITSSVHALFSKLYLHKIPSTHLAPLCLLHCSKNIDVASEELNPVFYISPFLHQKATIKRLIKTRRLTYESVLQILMKPNDADFSPFAF